MPGFKQLEIFDVKAGREQRELGLLRAVTAASRQEPFAAARAAAVAVAQSRPDRTCTADDVQEALIQAGYKASELGNAAGAVFRGKRWRHTGLWRASARASNHGHQNRVWELVAEGGVGG